MPIACPNLKWCIVRLGNDMNWWVDEVTQDVHWDVDGLSIIDPKQMAHILDLLDPLREYGLQMDLIDAAFYRFRIEKNLGNGRVLVTRVERSLLDSDEKLFALPDILDEEKGPYADFLDHITRLRIKLLNDLIDFEKNLTVEEVEEEIRDRHQLEYMEGRALHSFQEIMGILEYVPEGFTLDEENGDEKEEKEDDDYNDIPDIDLDEEDEEFKGEDLDWGKEEDEDEENEDLDSDENEEDEDDYDEEEDESPNSRSNKQPLAPKGSKSKSSKKK